MQSIKGNQATGIKSILSISSQKNKQQHKQISVEEKAVWTP
jgi:hypothetical protein